MIDDAPPTRFYIEALRQLPDSEASERYSSAWVPVGSIDLVFDEYGARGARDALAAWEGEQEPRPPVGVYRVWRHETYGLIAQQYEITERVEREITRVEGPAERQLRDDIVTLSMAALTPAEGQGAA